MTFNRSIMESKTSFYSPSGNHLNEGFLVDSKTMDHFFDYGEVTGFPKREDCFAVVPASLTAEMLRKPQKVTLSKLPLNIDSPTRTNFGKDFFFHEYVVALVPVTSRFSVDIRKTSTVLLKPSPISYLSFCFAGRGIGDGKDEHFYSIVINEYHSMSLTRSMDVPLLINAVGSFISAWILRQAGEIGAINYKPNIELETNESDPNSIAALGYMLDALSFWNNHIKSFDSKGVAETA